MDESKRNHAFLLKMTCVITSVASKFKYLLFIALLCGISFDIYKTITFTPIYQTKLNAYLLSENNSYAQLEETKNFITTMNYVFNGQSAQHYVEEKMGVDHVDYTCTLTSIDGSNQVIFSVKSAKRSNAYFGLKYLIEWYDSIENKMDFNYELVEEKSYSVSKDPMNMNSHMSNVKKGVLIGFIGGCAVLSIFYYLRDTIKTPYDMEEKIKCRLYAKIPKEHKPLNKKFWKKQKQALLITSIKTSFYYKESIKKLRHRLEESSKKHGYQVIMVTSSLENEGKSSIVSNLAISLADNHHKVLLIDGDFKKPSLHKIFRLNQDEAINDYLNGEKKWTDVVETMKKRDLGILCARQDYEHSEDLLRSEEIQKLLDEARYVYDYILIDSSPARYLNDSVVLNEKVDATLVVVKQDVASSQVVNETILRLVNMKDNVIGCVYNASVVDLFKQQHAYGYRYGYNRYDKGRRQSNE